MKYLFFFFVFVISFRCEAQRFRKGNVAFGYLATHYNRPFVIADTNFYNRRPFPIIHGIRAEYFIEDQVSFGIDLGYKKQKQANNIERFDATIARFDAKLLSPGLFRNRVFLRASLGVGALIENYTDIFGTGDVKSAFSDFGGGLTFRPIKNFAIGFDLPNIKYALTKTNYLENNGSTITGEQNGLRSTPYRLTLTYLFISKK